MPSQPIPPPSLTSKSIPYLFALLLVAQALDLHSTLLGISSRTEQNQLINWLALHIGFTQALIFFKVVAASVLLFFYRTWRNTKGQLDTATAICLVFLSTINLLVVANNYLQG